MEGSLSHRNTTLRYAKLSKSLLIVFTTFSQPEKSIPFCWNQHHQDGSVSALLDVDIVVLTFCAKKT